MRESGCWEEWDRREERDNSEEKGMVEDVFVSVRETSHEEEAADAVMQRRAETETGDEKRSRMSTRSHYWGLRKLTQEVDRKLWVT
ncbi:hypothetical protein NDU88_002255 [Pleurodeles waltl]|uniref:Uncharacterized protein n=1 Tax=Pleurodeles waltl TaxID=8319 RepID=A0AAV7U959_PLEWA|nr:hypothetical protein NDU88_002255 [Pleurodeles waltl]